jgi:hypothetical protein
MTHLAIHETFQQTIQGEGYWAGTPVDYPAAPWVVPGATQAMPTAAKVYPAKCDRFLTY